MNAVNYEYRLNVLLDLLKSEKDDWWKIRVYQYTLSRIFFVCATNKRSQVINYRYFDHLILSLKY